MSSKIRNVALLLPAFVLATGLASAQGVKVSSVNSDGTVSSTSVTSGSSGGPAALAPFSTDGNSKYWDGLGLGGASTNYFTQVPYIVQTPNPQIAVGPDDILTIVNRTIARYPNPNSAGQTATIANPYNYNPTEFAPLDVWMGLTVLGGLSSGTALCPSGTGSNSTCVIDNASVRYDQLQGRFVVLFTVTDLPAHRSNFVLVVSRFAQLQQCATPPTIGGAVCQTPLFTSPVIAPIVGGTSTGGVNTFNWVLYAVPINLTYNTPQQPSALGLINNPLAIPPLNSPLANSATSTLNNLTFPSALTTPVPFLTTPFCINGGPQLPLTPSPTGAAGGTTRSCTNYYPTGARFGLDNDNIILTAPVLDMAFAQNEGNFPSAAGQFQGPYAGTRVVAVDKRTVYNGKPMVSDQPGPTPTNPANANCLAATPISCNAVNLADDAATGTLTEITTQIAFGQGASAGPALVPGVNKINDLGYGQTGSGFTAISSIAGQTSNNSCFTTQPLAVVPPQNLPVPPAAPTASQAVLSCAPLATLTRALPAIFWEPDNLRGRALASFDAQIAPFGNAVSGVIVPFDYLVGTQITDNFGQGTLPPTPAALASAPNPVLTSAICQAQPQPGCNTGSGLIPQGVSGITGQSNVVATVAITALTAGSAGPPVVGGTITVSAADAAKLAIGDVTSGCGSSNAACTSSSNNGLSITLITGTTITLSGPITGTPTAFSFIISAVPGSTVPLTAGLATKYYIQPIIFNCPGTALFGGASSVVFCGSGVNGTQALVADLPVLGTVKANVSTLAQVADPSPVGQGFGPGTSVSSTGTVTATQLTTSPANNPVTSVAQDRIFVGDSRPQQVLFREGLLYIARSVRLADQQVNWLGTSTVLYDIIKTCAGVSGTPSIPTCGSYSITGGNVTSPNLAFEYEWYNSLNIPDPSGDLLGFGFYAPMFDVPADVLGPQSPIGPVSPSQGAIQILDKLFVGMTTGGTSNTLAIFSKDYPSLWDFRPGDDAYDTILPAVDPYTGAVINNYNGTCGNNSSGPSTTAASVTATAIAAGSQNITVASATGLGIGQTVNTGLPIVATFSPGTVGVTAASVTSSSGVSTTPVGNAKTSAFTCLAAGPGCPLAAVSTTAFGITSLMNVGPGEAVIGARGSSVTTTTTAGSSTINIPNTTPIAIGDIVEAPGNFPQIGNPTLLSPCTATIAGFCQNTFVTNITVNPVDNSLQVTLSQPALQTGSGSVIFDDSSCFGASNAASTSPAGQRVTSTTNNSAFLLGPANIPGVTYNGTLGFNATFQGGGAAPTFGGTACSSFYADATGTNTQTPATTTGTTNTTAGTSTTVNGLGSTAGVTVGGAVIGVIGTTSVFPVGTFVTSIITTAGGNCTTAPCVTVSAAATMGGTATLSFFTPNPSLAGIVIDNGMPATFLASGIVSGSILNVVGTTVTLSAAATIPGGGAATGNIPINFSGSNGFTGGGTTPTCPLISWSSRGGASTDPNDGSLWLFGEFAKNRLSTIPGPGQWGTSVANYALSFPATDVYGNDNTYFQDVQPPNTVNSTPDSGFFTWIQIAKNLGLAVPSATGPCSINNGVTPIQQPPASGTQPVSGASTLGCPYFGPDTTVTRAEMAYWVVKSQMDEPQVSNYLCATGGDPTGIATGCAAGSPAFTFADVASGVNNPFLGAVPSLNIAGVTTAQLQRYIEVMVRRGYTKGCGASTSDPLFGYCPNSFVTRAQMAVFLIRAKMNNVFPTTLSGLQLSSPYGDNFGVFTPSTPYFSDVSGSDPVYGPYAIFIQKMRELRITNGTSGSTFSPGNNLTRKEIATFTVRAFFL